MCRTLLVAAYVAALPLGVGAAAPRANVVTEAVRGIRVVEAQQDTSVLLVFVVDDSGDAMNEVEVTVLAAGKEVASARSDSQGRALFRLSLAGPVTVSARDPGMVPSEAHGVILRMGGLTSVALPLEEAYREKRPG